MKKFLPLSIPIIDGKEKEYVNECLDTFDHVKKGIEVKGLGREGSDDDGNINKTQVSEDMRRVLSALGSDEAAKIGAGGGSSAQRAAQEALDLAKRKDAEENKKRGIETKPDPVDNGGSGGWTLRG